MSKKLVILFAASALLLMACDVSSVTSQFAPQDLQKQAAFSAKPQTPRLRFCFSPPPCYTPHHANWNHRTDNSNRPTIFNVLAPLTRRAFWL